MIRTTHVAKMLGQALALADLVDGTVDDERLVDAIEADRLGAELPVRPHGATTWMALERAANLARHAADELDDELLRAGMHWPVV